MTWYISKEAHYAVIKELEEQTDRGAGIIGAAFVEERLTEAINSCTSSFSKNASFASKIEMAFSLGFYGGKCHQDLKTIKDIRNAFAHTLEPINLRSKIISEKCKALWLPQNILENGSSTPPTSSRALFLRAINLLNGFIWSEVNSGITKNNRRPNKPHFLPW